MRDNITSLVLNNAHTLIAGKTGSGKSVLLNDIILHIISEKMPLTNEARFEEAGMILIDPKRVEFSIYKKCPHTLRHATDEQSAIEALHYAIDIMMQRFKVMEELGCKQWIDKHIYIIFDEFADFSGNKEISALVERISRLGRAANIHLIIATQRPSISMGDRAMSPATRANLDGRIALRVAEAKDSRMIIGCKGAEDLPRFGYCIVDFPCLDEMITYSVNYNSDDKIKQFVELVK